MLPWIIGLGLAALGGALVVAYWNEIVDWLADFIPKVRELFRTVKRNVAHAAGMFIQRIKDAYAKIMHKLYYKEEGKWIEETTTRTLPENEVPPRIRNLLRSQETDATEAFEQELKLKI